MNTAIMGDYVSLMKPRVMSLVVFTSIVGLALAPGLLTPARAATAILCIAIGAGAAGALNMWYDRDIDRIMARTASRPIPTGRVPPRNALIFGMLMAVASVATLGVLTNWLAAALLALTIAYYLFVYTVWLKRRSTQGVVIGGAAGALPPVVGWAAVTGEVGLPALSLFAIIFVWTPPHSWALALFRSDDYARAHLPLLPVDKGHGTTKRQIFGYVVALWPVSLLPYFTGIGRDIYLVVTLIMSLLFVLTAGLLTAAPAAETERRARDLFKFSILYLFVLFATLLLERVLGEII